MLFHFSRKLPGVDRRVKRKKGCAEAGGKGGLRIGDAALGSGNLRCVAAEEMVLSLFDGEDRYRRKDPGSVRREEDDVPRMARPGDRSYRILDVVDGIGDARILGRRSASRACSFIE